MKKVLWFGIVLISLFSSCDDGDLIVTNFDFDEDTSLQFCSTETETVIFAIETDPNETIFFKFNNGSFEGSFEGIALDTTVSYNVNDDNQIIYRSLSGSITANYFCNTIPPTQSNVNEEYISTNGGTVKIITTVKLPGDDDADTDGDGVSDLLEGRYETPPTDTDEDGIPDYLDKDDDNDNVLTQVENNLSNQPMFEDTYPDTDEDGIPNYLDEDDDGDGVLTRNEDLNAADNVTAENPDFELNPSDDDTNQNGIPNYLDEEDTSSLEVNQFKANELSRTFTTLVIAENISLRNTSNDEVITLETLILGKLQVTKTVSVTAPIE
ncbi:hypothetical protein RBU60_07480 [Mesonia sp. MT50]|uniref:Uncharacterized protein n=1 Tax=Mesonia profundi TaxID=3070998 RepID=A0ABU1A407_9FLAO|nr:hypothetical protein [Mesonia profundi]MDQ7917411.1 hypothetical protein [Mesonia profundi]